MTLGKCLSKVEFYLFLYTSFRVSTLILNDDFQLQKFVFQSGKGKEPIALMQLILLSKQRNEFAVVQVWDLHLHHFEMIAAGHKKN